MRSIFLIIGFLAVILAYPPLSYPGEMGSPDSKDAQHDPVEAEKESIRMIYNDSVFSQKEMEEKVKKSKERVRVENAKEKIDDYYKTAKQLEKNGQYEEALQYYKKIQNLTNDYIIKSFIVEKNRDLRTDAKKEKKKVLNKMKADKMKLKRLEKIEGEEAKKALMKLKRLEKIEGKEAKKALLEKMRKKKADRAAKIEAKRQEKIERKEAKKKALLEKRRKKKADRAAKIEAKRQEKIERKEAKKKALLEKRRKKRLANPWNPLGWMFNPKEKAEEQKEEKRPICEEPADKKRVESEPEAEELAAEEFEAEELVAEEELAEVSDKLLESAPSVPEETSKGKPVKKDNLWENLAMPKEKRTTQREREETRKKIFQAKYLIKEGDRIYKRMKYKEALEVYKEAIKSLQEADKIKSQ
ncbi:MAG: hypothetical protein ISS34_05125 [Candidatus Omnitrophica bacterium]|nr:hypothetical protein [Candidatus Omnitrophota bacterium]